MRVLEGSAKNVQSQTASWIGPSGISGLGKKSAKEESTRRMKKNAGTCDCFQICLYLYSWNVLYDK
jgi:hypothetical protein